jgi:hypothetical protein
VKAGRIGTVRNASHNKNHIGLQLEIELFDQAIAEIERLRDALVALPEPAKSA